MNGEEKMAPPLDIKFKTLYGNEDKISAQCEELTKRLNPVLSKAEPVEEAVDKSAKPAALNQSPVEDMIDDIIKRQNRVQTMLGSILQRLRV